MLRGDTPPRQSFAKRLRLALFGLLYGPAARCYDPFVGWLFLGEWARWQRSALAFVPESGVVVELGAGTGALAATGARPGRLWLGIEPSPSMLAVARPRRGNAGFCLVQARAQAIPIATRSVDAVVATFPTPYLLAPATAGEIRRILEPGGVVVVVLSGVLAAAGVRRRLRRFALDRFYGRRPDESGDDFALPGFVGSLRRVETQHGVATLYVGKPHRPGAAEREISSPA